MIFEIKRVSAHTCESSQRRASLPVTSNDLDILSGDTVTAYFNILLHKSMYQLRKALEYGLITHDNVSIIIRKAIPNYGPTYVMVHAYPA